MRTSLARLIKDTPRIAEALPVFLAQDIATKEIGGMGLASAPQLANLGYQSESEFDACKKIAVD